jgi:hypothetical protein
MTNKYIVRSTSGLIHDNEDKLLEDEGLIILLEAAKHIQKNNVDRIRYTNLKRLCNEKLAYLTDNHKTDFGGKFEDYIVKFESKDEPNKRMLKREKIRRKESYIIPNIEKIRVLFTKKTIINLIDEDPVSFNIKGPIYEKSPSLSEGFPQAGYIELPKNQNELSREELLQLLQSEYCHKIYTVSYYYKNGSPVFLGNDGVEKDPMPFYEDERYLSKSKA